MNDTPEITDLPESNVWVTDNRRGTVHQFSRVIAKTHGIKAAILCSYLATRISQTRKSKGEAYRCTSEELTSHYPYMSRSTIAKELARLAKQKILTVHHKNWKSWDHTGNYTFTTLDHQKTAVTDPIYFRVDEAVRYGLPAALLLTNFRMRLKDEQNHNRLKPYYRVCANKLSKVLPLTRSTINRALKGLVEIEKIRLRRCEGFDRSQQLDTEAFLADDSNKDSCGANLDSHSAKPDSHGAKPDSHGAKPDSHGAKPDIHGALLDVHDAKPDIFNTLEANLGSEPSKFPVESFNSYEARSAEPSASSIYQNTYAGEPAANESESSHAGGDAASSSTSEADVSGMHVATSASKANQSAHLDSIIDESNPFAGLKSFTPLPRIPLPPTFAELEKCTISYYRHTTIDRELIAKKVSIKTDAIIEIQGVARLFRWLTIKDDEELYGLVKEVVERCKNNSADFFECDGQFGIDRYCALFWVAAYRGYLDDSPLASHAIEANPAESVLSSRFSSYYHQHEAELKRDGLGHLRCGDEVRRERCASPDAKLENEQHLSAAEKTRVFENALLSINRLGGRDRRGKLLSTVVTVTKKGLNLVRDFFAINQNWCAFDLLSIMDLCIQRAHYEADPGGYRKDFAVTRGTDLTYFMRHLERIVMQLGDQTCTPPVIYPDDWAK